MSCSVRVTLKRMHWSDERTLMQRMHSEGTKHTSAIEEESKMESCKSDMAGLSQISASVLNGEDRPQPVHRRPADPTIRVREIDCMLADIQAHIQRLRRERTHLGLVREELAGEEASGADLHRATPRRRSRLSAGSLGIHK